MIKSEEILQARVHPVVKAIGTEWKRNLDLIAQEMSAGYAATFAQSVVDTIFMHVAVYKLSMAAPALLEQPLDFSTVPPKIVKALNKSVSGLLKQYSSMGSRALEALHSAHEVISERDKTDKQPTPAAKANAGDAEAEAPEVPVPAAPAGSEPVEAEGDNGATAADLRYFAADGVDSKREVFWPCSDIWGLGFASSSFIAQESLLEVCRRAGLNETHARAPDNDVPASTDLDDVMLFTPSGDGRTSSVADLVDKEMLAVGIEKHAGEDVTDSMNTVCVGIDLIDGTWWWPPAERMWVVLLAVTWICKSRRASPAGLLALLGVIQWFDLMRRSKLSCYSAIYAFVADW